MPTKWQEENKEYLIEYRKKYNQKPETKERNKIYQKTYRRKLYMKGYIRTPKQRAKRRIYRSSPERKAREKFLRENAINSWIGIIIKETNCSICNRKIIFNSKNKRESIYFDHRHEGKESIKINPTCWLMGHPPIEENIKIWKSCDFGILCCACNHRLPTLNRMEFLNKALIYAKETKCLNTI